MERIPSERPAVILRTLTGALVLFSIMVTYYVMIIEKDYLIITNPDGPDTEEYFLELFGE